MFKWCLCVIKVLCDVCTVCVFVICMLVGICKFGVCRSVCDMSVKCVVYVFCVVCV